MTELVGRVRHLMKIPSLDSLSVLLLVLDRSKGREHTIFHREVEIVVIRLNKLHRSLDEWLPSAGFREMTIPSITAENAPCGQDSCVMQPAYCRILG